MKKVLIFLFIILSTFAFSQDEPKKVEIDFDLKSDNPYKVLGLEDGADIKQAKKNYRKLSKLLHPDKFPDNPMANDNFATLSLAWESIEKGIPFKEKPKTPVFGSDQIEVMFRELYRDLAGKNDIYMIDMVFRDHGIKIGYMSDRQRLNVFELIKEGVKEGFVDGGHAKEIAEKTIERLLHSEIDVHIISRDPNPIVLNAGLDDMDRLNTQTYSRYLEFMGDTLTSSEVLNTLDDYQVHRASLAAHKDYHIVDDSVFNNMVKNSLKGRSISLEDFKKAFAFGEDMTEFAEKTKMMTEGGLGYVLEAAIPNLTSLDEVNSLKPYIKKALKSKLMDKKGLKKAYFKKLSSLGKKFAWCTYAATGQI